jgi:hypothetical protein
MFLFKSLLAFFPCRIYALYRRARLDTIFDGDGKLTTDVTSQ